MRGCSIGSKAEAMGTALGYSGGLGCRTWAQRTFGVPGLGMDAAPGIPQPRIPAKSLLGATWSLSQSLQSLEEVLCLVHAPSAGLCGRMGMG